MCVCVCDCSLMLTPYTLKYSMTFDNITKRSLVLRRLARVYIKRMDKIFFHSSRFANQSGLLFLIVRTDRDNALDWVFDGAKWATVKAVAHEREPILFNSERRPSALFTSL